ncbi:MAG TPA: heme-copper oxidase subunit III [Methylomirabilota bacterium]
MSTVAAPPPVILGRDGDRGTTGMLLFILTEAMLFVCLFFSYFYLARDQPRWPMDPPPKLLLASIMLGVLLASSVVLSWGEKQLDAGRVRSARAALGITLLLGAGFLVMQGLEYRDHMRTLLPTSNAYGSIFYTITSFHALHLGLGLLMLLFVLVLPELHARKEPPYRPMQTASLYWHFVDGVWVVIVALLYVWPNLHR